MFRDRVLRHYRDKGYTLRERVQVRGTSGTVHACDLVAQGPLGNLVVQFEDYGGFEGPELDAVRRIARDVGATPVVAAEQVTQTVRRHAAQTGVVVLDDDALTAPPPREAPAAVETGPEYPPWPGQDRRRDVAGGEARETAWPADGRARPEVPARMDPGEVDDLITEWTRPGPPRPTRREDPGFWKYGDEAEPASPRPAPTGAPVVGFSWLDGPDAPTASAVEAPTGATEAPPTRPRPAPAQAPTPPGQPARPASAPEARETPVVAIDLRWLAGLAVAGACAGAAFLGLGVLFGVL